MIPLSVLDLVPITEGSDPHVALTNSLDLAQHAERLEYNRIWVAEHHNSTGIASAATAVVIGHLAAGTSTIRVGAGGVMLPNHAPYVIAEQFGTLESLYPGRIDLGLGRAPGTDQLTVQALRRDPSRAQDFPQDVQELEGWFGPVAPSQPVRAVPGAGLEVPLWILGSSTFGAQLAAALGLPYAFASHFAPNDLSQALALYRGGFQPSRQLETPYVMLGVNVVAAETDADARRLFTTIQQSLTNSRRGRRGPYPPPIDDIEGFWTPGERAITERMLSYSVVGSPATVRAGLEQIIETTQADELMVVTAVYDHASRVRSYELLAQVASGLRAVGADLGP